MQRGSSEFPPSSYSYEQPGQSDPKQLGEQLLSALSHEERWAREVFAVFDDQSSVAEFGAGTTPAGSPEAVRQAVIARLLLEHAVKQSDQLAIAQWRADLDSIPEFNT